MAPFGRSFLRARLKHRSKDPKASAAGKEVPVWVCEEEKAVCGITKRTTCEDVVQALLEDHRSGPEDKRVLQSEPNDYCLLERWKGFERVLPPLTRILRLWEAWGDEQLQVRFVLVNSRELAVQTAYLGGPSKPWDCGTAQYVRSLPEERRRRAVQKAFRKLDRIKRERRPQRRHRIDRMVQLIIAQDHTIQQQVHRMRELDLEIEQMERLLQPEHESSGREWEGTNCDGFTEGAVGQSPDSLMEEYLSACGRLSKVDLQVETQWDLVERLTRDIDAEIQQVCRAEAPGTPGIVASVGPNLEDPQEVAELGRMMCDLEHCVRYGLSLQAQVVELQGELKHSEAALHWGHQECENLAAQLSTLQVDDGAEPARAESGSGHTQPPTELTDTDSDTGISSTHSQDSLTPCGELPPPLDTDL